MSTDTKAKKVKKQLTEDQVERRNKLIEGLKGLIFPLILLAIIGGFIFFIVTYQNKEVEEEIIEPQAFTGEQEEYVLENDDLILTMDAATTQFTLKVKSSGKVWSSNPEGAEGDSAALPEERKKLQSTLLMSYALVNGLETPYNTQGFSIENGVYDIEQGDDYIKVLYSIGDVEREYVIPPVLSEADFQKWTDAMSKEGKNLTQDYYKEYDINNLKKSDLKKNPELADDLRANYPMIDQTIIYVLRDSTKENVKKTLQKFFAEAGYTYEDLLADKENDLSESTSDKPVFNINMIYRLDGNDLVVELPMDEMEYKSDYHLYTVTPLPYFGAGGKEDSGYMLVPEGGGALINFNNGKISQNSYYANIYGWDMALSRKELVHNTRAYYNVFGISDGSDSFVCILEDGRSYASVQADIAGKNHSFNFVNAVYSMCTREQYDVGDISISDVYEYLWQLPEGSLVQRYRFIDSGEYSDMAVAYRDYLKDNYGSMVENTDTSAPVAIELVGAIDKVKQIVGVPVSRPLKLTTFDEAGEILTDLSNNGFTNIDAKLTGWCNGGVNQKLLKRINVISDLGGKGDLKSLAATADSLGIPLYLNGVTQYAYDSHLVNGFNSFRDAAKFISKERAELFQYSHITYQAREGAESFYLMHAPLINQMAENLVSFTDKVGTGVCFEDNGKDLSSDYYRKNYVSRQAELEIQQEQFKTWDSQGKDIMINMGNEYAAVYSDMVTEMDLRGSEYTILDEYVPFYQMALHGYVNYTGPAINMCGDPETMMLYSAEYGAGLLFTFMKETAFATQKTLYPEYYGANYDSWRDDAIALYSRYNAELGHTFNQEMTGHDNLSETVSMTVYEDGTKVYVNYGYNDFDADGVTVPARDYLVVR